MKDKTPYDVWKKRLEKESDRPSYHETKKEMLPEEYDEVKVVINGKEKKVSRSSKYMLDMMITDD